MKCPVCKYENQKGATHCGLCYEVFNRSAADSYMHAVKRERREAEGFPDEPSPTVIKSQKIVNDAQAAFENVDWQGLADNSATFLKRHKNVVWIVLGAVALWAIGSFILDPSLWYHLFGKKLTYRFSGKAPTQYLVGMDQDVKVWSERQGRLDTPMEQFKVEEFANLFVERKKATDKSPETARVTAGDWVQMLHDSAGDASHAIPKNHPSLAEGRLVFDKKGALAERRYTPSPRLGKSLPFIAPRFPKGSLRRGRTWNETIEWRDAYHEWMIDWSATLHWTAGELEPCGDDTCLKLTYTAEAKPRLRAWPAWANGAVRPAGVANSKATGEGTALVDASHQRLFSNTFSYEGLLHVPLSDVGRIPWDLRVGRGVRGQPGEIVAHFQNKVNIHKQK